LAESAKSINLELFHELLIILFLFLDGQFLLLFLLSYLLHQIRFVFKFLLFFCNYFLSLLVAFRCH
jgi:hypothetical protein